MTAVKSKRAAAMERLRKARKEAGLVEFRCWCKPTAKEELQLLADELQRGR